MLRFSGLRMRSMNKNGFFDDFQSYNNINKFLKNLVKLNPKITKLIKIGKTFEKRDLNVIRIGLQNNNNEDNNNNKPIIWLDACIHAREWIACSTACFIIQQLINEFKAKNQITINLLKTFDYYILALANPDGYQFTRDEFRLWRKNRSQTSDPECPGVDLNRNFDYKWNISGTSGDVCSQIYSGMSSMSELETQSISSFILLNKNRLLCYLSFHAFGQYFMYPWGWTKHSNISEQNNLHEKAMIATNALKSLYNTKYIIGSPSYILYEASGGSDDWAYGSVGIKYSYTIELRDNGLNGFLIPPKEIIETGRETYLAIKTLSNELYKEIINK